MIPCYPFGLEHSFGLCTDPGLVNPIYMFKMHLVSLKLYVISYLRD